MKKLAILTGVIALATAFAAGAEAKAIKVSAGVFFDPCVTGGGTATVSSNTVVTGTVLVTITKNCTVTILNDAFLKLKDVDLDGAFALDFVAGSRTVLTISNDSMLVKGLNVDGNLTFASGARSRLDISGSTLSGALIDLSAGGGFSRINIFESTLTSGSDLFIAASPSGGNNGGRTVVEDSDLTSAGGPTDEIEVSASFNANNGIVSVSGGTLDGGTGAGGIKIRAGFKSKTTAKFITFLQDGNPATAGDVVIDGTNCKSIGNDPDVDCL